MKADLAARFEHPAADRIALAPIGVVHEQSHLRAIEQRFGMGPCGVGAGVVDQQNLEDLASLLKVVADIDDRASDGKLLVEYGHDD